MMPTFHRSNDIHFPMLIQMGKCRQKGCKMFGKFGPKNSKCPGNHDYLTRSHHTFKDLIGLREKSESNNTDFENSIGICESVMQGRCLNVGYPGMVCMSCANDGYYSKTIKPNEEMLIDVFVNKYYAACELALFCPLQKINFHDVIDDSYEDEMEDDNSIIT